MSFNTSASTALLDAALAKAQRQIKDADKDKFNPHFRSQYADLTAVWAACREALSSNGISVTQWPIHSNDDRLHVVTRLACGGEWQIAEASIPVQKNDAHGYGSALTYLKRFALAAAVGVAPEGEDDDGNLASTAPKAPRPSVQPSPVKPIKAAQPTVEPVQNDLGGLLRDGEKNGWSKKEIADYSQHRFAVAPSSLLPAAFAELRGVVNKMKFSEAVEALKHVK